MIDYSVLAIPKHRPESLVRGWKKQERARQMDEAYALVDARDGDICRVTGRRLTKGRPGTVPLRIWLTHHHLKKRSTYPGDKYDPRNIFVVCGQAHRALEGCLIEVEGTNAYRRLIFRWNRRIVPVGKEPFRIRSSNRSSVRGAEPRS